MKVLYVANHGQTTTSNDDEGAITHALTVLGHEVRCVPEASRVTARDAAGVDLVLSHKWADVDALRRLDGVAPRAFWYFDLVDWPGDPSLVGRCEQRRHWMATVLPHVDFGFCTDGDWVANCPPEWGRHKLRHLPQGFDERLAGWVGEPARGLPPVLLTGISAGGGRDRQHFVDGLRVKLGTNLNHVRYGLYREHLCAAAAGSACVVCPAAPVTARYCSNRVYNAAGMGACVLHPAVNPAGYGPADLLWYDADSLHTAVRTALDYPEVRAAYGRRAREATLARHLYRHRVAALLTRVTRTPA